MVDIVALGAAKVDAKRRYDRKAFSRLRPLNAFPTIHPSPPTIGALVDITGNQSGTTGSVITGAVLNKVYTGSTASTFDNTRFSLEGWTPTVKQSAGFFYAQPAAPLISGSRQGGSPMAFEWELYSAAFDIRMYAETGFSYRLWVDDQPVTTTATSPAVTTGHVYVMPITLSGYARRRYRLEINHSGGFGGLHVGPTDSLLSRRVTPRPQMLLVGDSYSDGATGVVSLDTYAYQLGILLGVDMFVDGIGGTGFVATGSATGKSEYLTRIVNAATGDARLNPQIVMLQGSVNDSSGSIQTACTTAINQVRSQWPNAYIFVTGIMRPRQAVSLITSDTTANTAYRTACTGVPDLKFIDPVVDLWYSGTGRSGATTGAGNADLLMGTDSVHPTQPGHDFIAPTLAQYIRSAIAA